MTWKIENKEILKEQKLKLYELRKARTCSKKSFKRRLMILFFPIISVLSVFSGFLVAPVGNFTIGSTYFSIFIGLVAILAGFYVYVLASHKDDPHIVIVFIGFYLIWLGIYILEQPVFSSNGIGIFLGTIMVIIGSQISLDGLGINSEWFGNSKGILFR